MITLKKLMTGLAAVVLGLGLGSYAHSQEVNKELQAVQLVQAETLNARQPTQIAQVVSPRNVAPTTIALGGNNAWDYIVFGNGPQIYEILQSIKGFLIPTSGDSGFRTLLLFVSIIGVVLLAVQAGFNPIFGFPKLVFFILAAGFISITTFQMRVNLTINDPVRGYFQTVSGVPFIIGAPVSVISSVGMYFTRSVETQLTIPDSFKLVGGGTASGGKFNLFADMLKELDKFQFSSANLKAHISTYMLDCGIHGISRGRITADELLNSPALMTTLGKVATEAVLTKKFAESTTTTGTAFSVPTQELATCKESYDELKKSAEAEANALFTASSEQLASSGINVLAETAMTDLLNTLGANAGGIGGVSPISGRAIALQKGFSEYTGKAFTDAAQLTGNSELLMAVQVAQQEQAQKTSWAIGVKMFNNIMGYLFTVLQAFILALFPIMIVAFLIPGIGKKLMINMFQLLLWQALWLPGLAIVNYLVFVFSAQDVSAAYNSGGGFTINNSALISEAAGNATLAAQFLGTLVPVITWGLVKGTLAFSEFIGGGIGQSLASSAGSSVAGGNLSQGQISQNQVSANKFNTASSFTSGAQDPTAFMSSAPLAALGKGGQMQTAAGGTNSIAQEKAIQVTSSTALDERTQSERKATVGRSAQQSASAVNSAMEGMSGSEKLAFMTNMQTAKDLVEKNGGSYDKAMEEAQKLTNAARTGENKNTTQSMGAGVKASVGWLKDLAGLDAQGSADANLQLARQSAVEAAAASEKASKSGAKTSTGFDANESVKGSSGSDMALSFQQDASKKAEAALANSATASWASEIGASVGASVARTLSASDTETLRQSVNADNFGGSTSNPDAFRGTFQATQQTIAAAESGLRNEFTALQNTAEAKHNEFKANAEAQYNNFAGGAAGYQGIVMAEQDKLKLDAAAKSASIQAGLQETATRVVGEVQSHDGKTLSVLQTMNQEGTSMFNYAERNDDGSFKLDNGKLVTATDYQAVTAAGAAGAIIGGTAVTNLAGGIGKGVGGLVEGLGGAVAGAAGGPGK